MKVNQLEQHHYIEESLQLNVDMVGDMMEDSEKVKDYLDNIILIGALKGYKCSQLTDDYTFWKKHVISLQRDNDKFFISFSIKPNNTIESVEVRGNRLKLSDMLSDCVGDSIKRLPGDMFFSYHHDGILLMLETSQKFILSE
jgi:hypothetical protein